jgi:hypothetical protein
MINNAAGAPLPDALERRPVSAQVSKVARVWRDNRVFRHLVRLKSASGVGVVPDYRFRAYGAISLTIP